MLFASLCLDRLLFECLEVLVAGFNDLRHKTFDEAEIEDTRCHFALHLPDVSSTKDDPFAHCPDKGSGERDDDWQVMEVVGIKEILDQIRSHSFNTSLVKEVVKQKVGFFLAISELESAVSILLVVLFVLDELGLPDS